MFILYNILLICENARVTLKIDRINKCLDKFRLPPMEIVAGFYKQEILIIDRWVY